MSASEALVAGGPALLFAYKYITNPQVLYCPSTSLDAGLSFQEYGPLWHAKPLDYSQIFVGYSCYAAYDVTWAPTGVLPALTALRANDRPSKILGSDIMIHGFADVWNGHQSKAPHPISPAAGGPSGDSNVNFDGGNVMYNDGHVGWYDYSEVQFRFFIINSGGDQDFFF